MGRRKQKKSAPRVAVFLDRAGNYGRNALEGIADYVKTYGPWSLFVEPRMTGQLNVQWLKNWEGDGVLAYLKNNREVPRLARSGVPIVELYADRSDIELPHVGNDETAIGRLAAEHLAQLNLKNFAYSGYSNETWSKLRYQGFKETIEALGYECRVHVTRRRINSLTQWEQSHEQISDWLRTLPKPLGVMACSDRHAMYFLEVCRQSNIYVPDEVAVIGVDNDEGLCRLANPSLTSVADNPRKIGYEAARVLDHHMSGKIDSADIETLTIAPQGVVTRQSTGTTVLEDSDVNEAIRIIRKQAFNINLNVNVLLQSIPLSRSAFYRRFRAAVGKTPKQLISHLRTQRIKELLTQSTLSLENIGRLTGFTHTEYLIYFFRREVGMTPNRYRNRHLP